MNTSDYALKRQNMIKRLDRLSRRSRERRPISSATVRNVYSDHDGRLYMDLSNGMLLRADRPHGPVARKLIYDRISADTAAAGAPLTTALV